VPYWPVAEHMRQSARHPPGPANLATRGALAVRGVRRGAEQRKAYGVSMPGYDACRARIARPTMWAIVRARVISVRVQVRGVRR
jgi:hypothetical protein